MEDRVHVVKVDAASGEKEGEGLVFELDRLFEELRNVDLGSEHGDGTAEDGNECVHTPSLPSVAASQKLPSVLMIEFTMCNPPFYSTLEEAEGSKSGRDKEEMPFGVRFHPFTHTF